MSNDETKALEDIRDSLIHLSEVAKGAEQPTCAILNAQIFIIVQKVRFLLGEKE